MCVLACTVASCANCTKPDVCENCQLGFTLDKNGNCIERGVTSEADGNLLGIILGCVFGILLLLLFITILVIVIYVWRKRVTSRYSLPTVDKFSSHGTMLNPVYIPPDALEEADSGVKIEDDDEITVNKNALDSED